jgi:hypothetical protein
MRPEEMGEKATVESLILLSHCARLSLDELDEQGRKSKKGGGWVKRDH